MKEWTTEEEAANLRRLLTGVKNKAQFAKDYGVPGGASMLSQHQSGHRPISLDAAKAYAKGLGIGIGEIAPRFAKLVSDVSELAQPAPHAKTQEIDLSAYGAVPMYHAPDAVIVPVLSNCGSMGQAQVAGVGCHRWRLGTIPTLDQPTNQTSEPARAALHPCLRGQHDPYIHRWGCPACRHRLRRSRPKPRKVFTCFRRTVKTSSSASHQPLTGSFKSPATTPAQDGSVSQWRPSSGRCWARCLGVER